MVPAGEALDDGAGAVRRRAIDDEHLEIAPVLAEDRGQAVPEVGFLITGWYDDRNELLVEHRAQVRPEAGFLVRGR